MIKKILEFWFKYSTSTDSYHSGNMNIVHIGPQTPDIQPFKNDNLLEFL